MVSMDSLAHNFVEDDAGGCKAVQTKTVEFQSQAVQTSIYLDEHGGYIDCLFQRELS